MNIHSIKVFIILIQGGLGNQMFCYSFYLSLKKRFPHSLFLFKISKHVNQHQGLEVFDIFNIKGKWRYRLCKPSIFWKFFYKKEQKNALVFDNNDLTTNHVLNYYSGFWQSEKYFKNICSDIQKAFVFKKTLFNRDTQQMETFIIQNNSVSIHIRRGDYLNNPQCAVCDNTYYKKAIDIITDKSISPCFFIFSDDIEWCKKNLIVPKAYFVDINHNADSWQDMYLMSLCKHNIIANSTFSWWGAWLNDNPDKIVIAPKIWFIGSYKSDIIPDDWIKL